MQCARPIDLKDRVVPCGRCGNCIQRYISDWVVRCKVEWKASFRSYFVTLTYEKNGSLQVYKKDVQRWFKRLRRVGEKFSYFLVSDYGDVGDRPHYHVLMFGKDVDFSSRYFAVAWQFMQWPRAGGFIVADPLTEGRIIYAISYVSLARLVKRSDGRTQAFFLMSKGLGKSYLTKAAEKWHLAGDNWYFPELSYKKPLPRYYRDRIFSEDLRQMRAAEMDVGGLFLQKAKRMGFTPIALSEAVVYHAKLFMENLLAKKERKQLTK